MKIIECLNDKISEELNDSESYANLALKYKESDKETAKLFYDLSGKEIPGDSSNVVNDDQAG